MISIHIYARESNDLSKLLWFLEGYNEVATSRFFDWHVWELPQEDSKEVDSCFTEMSLCDLLIVEVKSYEDLSYLKRIRRYYLQAELVLLINESILPEEFMSPYLHPISVIKRPFEEGFDQYLGRKMAQIFEFIFRKRESQTFYHRFKVASSFCHEAIPYSSIHYFESCNKKIILYSDHGTHEFYDSLSSMEEDLPGFFIRCHRSYIVNSIYIRGMGIGELSLILKDGSSIPISKKYSRRLAKVWEQCSAD